jgi:hypothetical protein
MIKLYVDDKRNAPDGWHLAKTITEAIRILATVPVEEISLDHDISYRVFDIVTEDFYEVDGQETFEPVVRYLALMPENIRPKFSVHSANPCAYDKYKNILENERNIQK